MTTENRTLVVSGCVTSESAPDGVHGIRVEVGDKDPVFDDRITETLTDTEGMYRAAFTEAEYAGPVERIVDHDPELVLYLFDRDGTEIHTTKGDPRACCPGEDVRIDFELDNDVLSEHLARPTTWERSEGRLSPPGYREDIERAIRLLPGTEGSGFYALRNAALCPDPALNGFESVLADAWGTIEGDPSALERFRETLDTIFAYGPDESDLPEYEPDIVPDGQGSRIGEMAPDDPVHETIPRERTVPLLLAASLLGNTAAEQIRYTRIVLGQICETRVLGYVHSAAIAALHQGGRALQHWESLVGFLGSECGPTDGPVRFPPRIEPECISRQVVDRRCLQEISATTKRYLITDISPSRQCAGGEITIRGYNFGSAGGDVIFGGGVPGNVTRWSDTQIVVEVPPGAGCSVKLDITTTVEVCGRFVTYTIPGGATDHFEGAAAKILRFTVNSERSEACLPPESTAIIAWNTCAANHVRVEVVDGDENTLVAYDPAPSSDELEFTVPDTMESIELTARITVEGDCSPARSERSIRLVGTRVPRLSIVGMEVTQGIQTFDLTGTGDRNTLPTIAGKDTIVRVYVASDRGGFEDDIAEDVTGWLVVDSRTRLAPFNNSVPTSMTARSAPNPFITARRESELDRRETNHSLNFLVPAALASGTRQLRVTVVGPDSCGRTPKVREQIMWTWQENAPLSVRFVRVRDDSGVRPSSTPDEDQARFTIQRAFDLLPFPPTDIAPARTAVLATTQDVATALGVDNLATEVERARSDSNIWVGLTVPFNEGIVYGGFPSQAAVSCIYQTTHGSGIASPFFNDSARRVKTAHELGHCLGLFHVNLSCRGASSPCPGPLPQCYSHPTGGVLRDVPFDPFWNRTLFDATPPDGVPTRIGDLMSYECTRWPSADTWTRLMESA